MRYKGNSSERKPLPGGIPQGTRLGMFLFLILINFAGFHNSEVVTNLGQHITKPLAKRKPIRKKHLKYIDDLSYLTSLDLKTKLKSDPNPNPMRPLNFHDRTGHFLPKENCEISVQLEKLTNFVEEHEMRINTQKTKVMLFNTARIRDFSPQVALEDGGEALELVEQVKLLGIIITSDMKWHANTAYLCEKGYGRLWMIRNLKRLGASRSELLEVYEKQCRSVLELAVPVWTAGLTSGDVVALERVQKSVCAIILGREYNGYLDALNDLNMKSLEERRMDLCIKFAKKSVKSDKYKHWFVKADKPAVPAVKTRRERIVTAFKQVKTRTDRFRDSPLPFLTMLLNKNM